MLKELGVPIIGVIENMKISKISFVKEQSKTFNVPFLGEIDFDEDLEDSIGDINKLLKTNFAQNMREIVLSTDKFKLRKEL
ncbi:hypothetical protein ES703_13380 [subsurface metagenome]